MGIRIRTVDGHVIALCEVESDEKPGDIYLDDGVHYALYTKFMEDCKDNPTSDGGDPILVALMEKEKVRDAQEVHEQWAKERGEWA